MNQASKVSKDDYSGRYIDHINYDLSDMSLGQGWRKFRKSHFKDKGILFENEHLQVGYKSQAVYEDLQEFKVFIKIGLYVGNKCNEQISRLDVDYEGDESSFGLTQALSCTVHPRRSMMPLLWASKPNKTSP